MNRDIRLSPEQTKVSIINYLKLIFINKSILKSILKEHISINVYLLIS